MMGYIIKKRQIAIGIEITGASPMYMDRLSRYVATSGAYRPRSIPRAIQINTQTVRYFSKKPRPLDFCEDFVDVCCVAFIMYHKGDSKSFELYEYLKFSTLFSISSMFDFRVITFKNRYFPKNSGESSYFVVLVNLNLHSSKNSGDTRVLNRVFSEKNYFFTDVALIEKVSSSPRVNFPDTNTISLLSGISPEKMTLRVSEFFLAA